MYDIEIFEARMEEMMDLNELSRMTEHELLSEMMMEMTDELDDDDFPF